MHRIYVPGGFWQRPIFCSSRCWPNFQVCTHWLLHIEYALLCHGRRVPVSLRRHCHTQAGRPNLDFPVHMSSLSDLNLVANCYPLPAWPSGYLCLPIGLLLLLPSLATNAPLCKRPIPVPAAFNFPMWTAVLGFCIAYRAAHHECGLWFAVWPAEIPCSTPTSNCGSTVWLRPSTGPYPNLELPFQVFGVDAPPFRHCVFLGSIG